MNTHIDHIQQDNSPVVPKTDNNKHANSSKWYQRTWFIVLSLIFLAPLGIFLTWKYANWSKNTKIIATIASALFFIFSMINSANAAPTLTIDNATNNRVETEEAAFRLSGTITGANDSTIITVNDKPAEVNGTKYSAVIELKEGDNAVTVKAKKNDKTVSETLVVYRLTAAEIAAKKADIDKKAADEKAEADRKAAEDAAAKKAASMPAEYKSALAKATQYANTQNMSKQGVFDQLTSQYGEQFSAAAAQYAIDNVIADWKANALAKAKQYQSQQSMSPAAIRDQLTSTYGEKFTKAEADYAIQHLND